MNMTDVLAQARQRANLAGSRGLTSYDITGDTVTVTRTLTALPKTNE